MKQIIFTLSLALFLSSEVKAQDAPVNTGLGFGMQLVEYQEDFGIGLNVTSPFFVYDRIAVRARTNWMYHQAVIDSATTWVPYNNFSLGVIGVGGYINDRIRLYGEGGVMVLLPSDEISTTQMEFGGYGIFGFEFFFSGFGNYFIEIGGVGMGAVADRLENKPIYSNGMSLSTGFRFSLK